MTGIYSARDLASVLQQELSTPMPIPEWMRELRSDGTERLTGLVYEMLGS